MCAVSETFFTHSLTGKLSSEGARNISSIGPRVTGNLTSECGQIIPMGTIVATHNEKLCHCIIQCHCAKCIHSIG
jgi:hypothetical protein